MPQGYVNFYILVSSLLIIVATYLALIVPETLKLSKAMQRAQAAFTVLEGDDTTAQPAKDGLISIIGLVFAPRPFREQSVPLSSCADSDLAKPSEVCEPKQVVDLRLLSTGFLLVFGSNIAIG
jgi:hypothetical protein